MDINTDGPKGALKYQNHKKLTIGVEEIKSKKKRKQYRFYTSVRRTQKIKVSKTI